MKTHVVVFEGEQYVPMMDLEKVQLKHQAATERVANLVSESNELRLQVDVLKAAINDCREQVADLLTRLNNAERPVIEQLTDMVSQGKEDRIAHFLLGEAAAETLMTSSLQKACRDAREYCSVLLRGLDEEDEIAFLSVVGGGLFSGAAALASDKRSS